MSTTNTALIQQHEIQERNELLLRLLISTLQQDSLYAVSETEPWGTFLATENKKNETRHWAPLVSQNTLYRGPLAIHAAKRMDDSICFEEPFASTLQAVGYTPDRQRRQNRWGLPLGSIIAIAWLDTTWQVNSRSRHRIPDFDSNEFAFGNYQEGRYIWHFSCAYRLRVPVPILRGAKGLWKWTPPDVVWDELQAEIDHLRLAHAS